MTTHATTGKSIRASLPHGKGAVSCGPHVHRHIARPLPLTFSLDVIEVRLGGVHALLSSLCCEAGLLPEMTSLESSWASGEQSCMVRTPDSVSPPLLTKVEKCCSVLSSLRDLGRAVTVQVE